MGGFRDLSKAEQDIAYRQGFEDGVTLESQRIEFLRRTRIGIIVHMVFGRHARAEYKRLFGVVFRRSKGIDVRK